MRHARIVLIFACAITPSLAQETAEGPTNEKAQKSYKEASEYLHRRIPRAEQSQNTTGKGMSFTRAAVG